MADVDYTRGSSSSGDLISQSHCRTVSYMYYRFAISESKRHSLTRIDGTEEKR